jgi:hypothetical protein
MAHTDNIIAFWDLDNDSTDDSGNGHTGTDTAISYDGTKATFNGSTSKVALTTIDVATVHTISLWGRMSSVASSYFICGPSNAGYTPGYGSNSLAYNDAADSVSVSWTGDTSLHNFVVTRNGSAVKFFVDGSQVGTTQTIANPTTHTNIGFLGGLYPAGIAVLNGTMQSVSIYSDDKSGVTGWVTAEYNSGTPKKWADWQGGGIEPTPYYYQMLAGSGVAA